MPEPTLNDQQATAVEAIKSHLLQDIGAPFMVFEGPAGTGKTFCMKKVARDVKRSIVFTAPTNKAVRVLREAITGDDYKPSCRTIYSLLGLQMQINGELKEIGRSDDAELDLSEARVVVIDEASMVNQLLWRYIQEASAAFPRLRWLLMGDRWQLPPVGEDMSPVWSLEKRVELSQVMRQDNSILLLASLVRGLIQTPFKALQLTRTDEIFPLTANDFVQQILTDADDFLAGKAKAIAWRNAVVDKLNRAVRVRLFADPDTYPWQPGDRITVTEPVKDLEGELVATTDEEGTVESATIEQHPIEGEFKCWRIVMRSDFNASVVLWSLHPSEAARHQARVNRMATEARVDKKLWKNFWEFKETFHSVRHAYAITAHRAQGSTYEKAYVNWRDVLLNQNRSEAYRCLYVAVTRPKKELYLG